MHLIYKTFTSSTNGI